VVLGLLGLATLPAAIAVTERVDGLSLVEAGFAIPAAVVFALAAIVIGRRVRGRSRQTLAALPGTRVARVGCSATRVSTSRSRRRWPWASTPS
jgi:hypothetical protein